MRCLAPIAGSVLMATMLTLLAGGLAGCRDGGAGVPGEAPSPAAGGAGEAEPVTDPAPETPEPPVVQVVYRVNCGAYEPYTDEAGRTWLADQSYLQGQTEWGAVGGSTVARAIDPPEGTPAPKVYLTERFEMVAYRFDVPDGTYDLRLHFAETWEGIVRKGERVFDVSVNTRPALEAVDPTALGGGFARPVVREVTGVEVTDGRLLIEFVPRVQNAEINGIEVLRVGP
jgi:hypothetical protein